MIHAPLDPVRAAIVTRLESVPDVGIVQPFERYATQMGDLAAFYGFKGSLRGWFLRRESRAEKPATMLGAGEISTDWQLRGYYALRDEDRTELLFDALVDAIIDAFRADDTLSGTVTTCSSEDYQGLQLQDAGPVLFANVLCHSARLRLTTRQFTF